MNAKPETPEPRRSIQVPAETHRQLRRLAAEWDCSMSAAIEVLLARHPSNAQEYAEARYHILKSYGYYETAKRTIGLVYDANRLVSRIELDGDLIEAKECIQAINDLGPEPLEEAPVRRGEPILCGAYEGNAYTET
jgi:hypothetical protein